MRCKKCNGNLAPHDLWCSSCGRQTPAVTSDLSAMASLARTWNSFKQYKGSNVPAAAISVIFGIIPMAVLIVLFHSFGLLDLAEITNTPKLLLNLLILSLSVGVFIPFILIPFQPVSKTDNYTIGLMNMKKAMSAYPGYLLFSLLSALYFVVIYLICFGFPQFGSDPILRLVWIVLVNYYFALVLPVPVLMERKQLSFWSAFRMSYKHFHVVRWNIYLLALVLIVLNMVGFLLLLIPLVITVPLSWYAIRDYTDLLLDFEIIRPQP
ncbi:MAG TPA: hypothetical protein PLA08_03275 [Candidatus Cloacimonadota bacterium]|nr:hypothetical protein [Candidatus Cloacimonadota bacterium]